MAHPPAKGRGVCKAFPPNIGNFHEPFMQPNFLHLHQFQFLSISKYTALNKCVENQIVFGSALDGELRFVISTIHDSAPCDIHATVTLVLWFS